MMHALSADERQRWRQLRKLTEASRALTYVDSLQQIRQLAVSTATELLHADRAALVLSEGDGRLLSHGAGLEPDALEALQAPLDEGTLARLAELLGDDWNRGMLSVPLVAGGQVIGVLAVGCRAERPLGDDEEWLLSALADEVALAIEYARLHERERERAGDDEARRRAVATLAHDVRSPLNAIDSYVELLELEMYGPLTAEQRNVLNRIRASSRHIVGVLKNVMEMARLSTGSAGVEPCRVRAAEIMREADLIVRPAALGKAQRLAIDCGPDPILWADPERLRQILVNLLDNAVKFTPRAGWIRVSASVRDDQRRRWGLLVVSDNGPGIPPDQAEAIFRPYYQLSAGPSVEGGGAGLGLAICREVAREMGGDVEVESRPGHGATFTVRLPLCEDAAEARPERPLRIRNRPAPGASAG